jgi:hypothetical protein
MLHNIKNCQFLTFEVELIHLTSLCKVEHLFFIFLLYNIEQLFFYFLAVRRCTDQFLIFKVELMHLFFSEYHLLIKTQCHLTQQKNHVLIPLQK